MGRQSRLKRERRTAQIERARLRQLHAEAGEARGCLICRERSGGFQRREHPIPESMGNTEIVLPNGVVCDRCNGGVLSDLDKGLCEFFPVKMRRTMLGIGAKSGNVPVTRFSSGTLRNVGLLANGQLGLVIEKNNANDRTTLIEKGRVGQLVELGLNVQGGRRLTANYCGQVARSLLKCALGCAWIDHEEMMLEPRFDHVRQAILGQPHAGFLAVLRACDPDNRSVSLTYNFRDDPGGQAIWALANFFGVQMFTDSRLPEPVGAASDEAVMTVRFGSTRASNAA